MNDKKLKFYTVSEDYMTYLKKYDNKIMDNTVEKERRQYLGIVFEIDNKKYLAPLTSPKPKHKTMKNNLDFIKINDGENGAINLNNMFPVSEKAISIKDIEAEKDIAYKNLLRKQITWCNTTTNKELISKNAEKLYNVIITKKNTRFHLRTCNFRLLEEKSLLWNKERPTREKRSRLRTKKDPNIK